MLVKFLEKSMTIVYQGLPDFLRKWLLNAILLFIFILKYINIQNFYLWNDNSHLIQRKSSGNLFMLTTVGFIN